MHSLITSQRALQERFKFESGSSGVTALEQSFQSHDHCESKVNHSPKQLEQYSNQLDYEPSALGDADHSKFGLPLAKNHLSVQCNLEFQDR